MHALRVPLRASMSFLVLATALTAVRADDAADRAARQLASLTAIRAELCADQLLGVYFEGKLVGFMRATLAVSTDVSRPAYDFELKAEMSIGDTVRSRVLAGQLAPNLAPLQADGEEQERKGRARTETICGFALDGGAIVWTTASGGAPEQTQRISGVADSITGIDFLLSRLWVGLPEGQPHCFRLFDVEKGRIRRVELARSAVLRCAVDGAEREVVELVRRDVDEPAGGGDLFVCDVATGQILMVKPAEAPVILRPITPELLARWRKGEVVPAPPPLGPVTDVPATPAAPLPPTSEGPQVGPIDVVAGFYSALARQDRAALLDAIEARSLAANTAAARARDAATRDRIRADVEARWAADPQAAADSFVNELLVSVDPEEMPKDPATYKRFLAAGPPSADHAEVVFTRADVRAVFRLARVEGRWRIVEQRSR